MDTPLYGDTPKSIKNLLLGVKVLSIAFSFAAIIVGVIYGVMDTRISHYILSIVIILALVATLLLVNLIYIK